MKNELLIYGEEALRNFASDKDGWLRLDASSSLYFDSFIWNFNISKWIPCVISLSLTFDSILGFARLFIRIDYEYKHGQDSYDLGGSYPCISIADIDFIFKRFGKNYRFKPFVAEQLKLW